MRRRSALLALLALAATVPARADMFQDASNAVLPWALETTNSAALNNGIHIITGYTGPIDSSVQVRWWGVNVQMGADTCQDHFYKLFRNLRGFAFGIGSCAAPGAGTNTSQFIPLVASIGSTSSATTAVAAIAQGFIASDNGAVMGLNTLKTDTYISAESTSSSIAGTTLTVGGTLRGLVNPGDIVSGTGVPARMYVVSQLTGTTGGAGTYKLNRDAGTVAATRISMKPYYSSGLVQDEYDSFCDLNDTSCRNIIDGSFPNGDQASIEGATLGGTVTAGDQLQLTITDATITGSPVTVSYTTVGGDTLATAAAGLAAALESNAAIAAANYQARAVGPAVRVYYPTNVGPIARPSPAFAKNVTGAATETVTLALISSGNDARYGLGTTLFAGTLGRWQNSFQSPNGVADYAMMIGTWNVAAVTGKRSQAIKWYYSDNTSAAAARVATLYVDPTGVGATGVDMVVGNNSTQATNLSVPVGNLKVGAMPTSAGAGGLAVCIDSTGVMYKKAACP